MKKLVFLLPFLFTQLNIFAQWSTFVFAYGGSTTLYEEVNNETARIVATSDGGCLIPGWANTKPHFAKLDRFGNLQWNRVLPYTGEYYAMDAVEHPDGRFTGLLRYNFQTENTALVQMDHQGNVLWYKTIDNNGLFCRAYRMIRTQDDGFLISVTTNATNEKQLYKVDANGNVQFIYTANDVDAYTLETFKQTPDQQFEAVYHGSNARNFIVRISDQGVPISRDTAQYAYQYGEVLVFPRGSNHYICIGTSNPTTKLYATLFDDQGQLIWEKTLNITYGSNFAGAVALKDGGFVVARNSPNTSVFNKFDSLGNAEWQRTFNTGIWSNSFTVGGIEAAADGGILAAGLTRLYGSDLDVFAYHITSAGKTRLNMVEGVVRQDVNLNCQAGLSDEPPLAKWLIELRKPGDTIIAVTEGYGLYRTCIDTGTYQVRAIPLNDLWEACPAQVTLTNPAEELNLQAKHFAIKPAALCSRIEVDITAPFLRRCFPGKYFVHCFNSGTKKADSVKVAILLDPYLSFDTSSVPLFEQKGDSLFFKLGPLDVGQSKDFSLNFIVDCDSTVIGQTHCTKAISFPNQLCSSINPNWSGASLDMNGKCMGDSLVFTLSNNGLGNMLAPEEMQLVRNDLLDSTIMYQLAANESIIIVVPANGSTWRMQTQQIIGHPFYGLVSATVEGCIAGGGQNFSTGFVTQFPTEDASPFVAVDCRNNIGAFDPNDKSVEPRGRGTEHLIAPDTDLEYFIRFQNTGTDTAFNIVIRDTLSHTLDPYSFIPGASSHSYNWGYDGPGKIYFSFNNILLPDSNVNEPASHGFIAFRVKQQKDNPNGTYIRNRAGIYFDFNEPIITNTTQLLVDKNVVTKTWEPISSTSHLFSIYPNPADQTISILTNQPITSNLDICIIDVMGKTLANYPSNRSLLHPIPVDQLPAGIYFVRITQAGKSIETKKLIVKH